MSPGMRVRLILGPLIGGAVLGALALDYHTRTAYAFGLCTAFCAVIATLECGALARKCGPRPWTGATLVGSVGVVVVATLHASPEPWIRPPPFDGPGFVMGWCVVVLTAWLARGRGAEDVGDLGASLFTVVYIGGFAACLLAIRGLRFGVAPAAGDPGLLALVWFALIAKSADIFAYFGGKALGRHPLAPVISPKKTWEGAVGGFLGSLVVGCALKPVMGAAGAAMGWLETAAFAATVSVADQVGDLVESRFKRRAGVKDSGGYLPEFGGVMDLTDGLVFAAPVGYAWLRATGG